MTVSLHCGQLPLQEIGREGFLLIHGGAGPQDPKGSQAKNATKRLSEILDAVEETPSTFESVDSGPVASRAHDWNPLWETLAKDQTEGTRRALAAAARLERSPEFNSGYGSALQCDGLARVSASFMESNQQKFSCVVNVPDCLHPSLLAAFLQGHRHSCRDALGGTELMRSLQIRPANLIAPHRFEQWCRRKSADLSALEPHSDGTGTIGAVSYDPESSQLTAVTSTGGVGFEPVGRIGDTPTVSGNYATQNFAISCTGYGEQINDLGFSVRVATWIASGRSLQDALNICLLEAAQRGSGLAAIALHRTDDCLAWACGTTEDYFVWAYRSGPLKHDFSLVMSES